MTLHDYNYRIQPYLNDLDDRLNRLESAATAAAGLPQKMTDVTSQLAANDSSITALQANVATPPLPE